MIRSMTAFASVRRTLGKAEIVWELKTVNHRYLEISPRLPRDWISLEPAVRELVGARLGRGKVDCILRLEATAAGGGLEIDDGALARLAAALATVDQALTGLSRPSALDVLRWEGVLVAPVEDRQALTAAALDVLAAALDELLLQRQREGASLGAVIAARCDELALARQQIAQRLPQVRSYWRQRMLDRIAELGLEVEPARLEQELLFAAQKMDVAEELERLQVHIQEVKNTLDSDTSVGRRLDFLMQELHRETNTIASKSADSAISQLTVDMKVLIEQMREQVQNVE